MPELFKINITMNKLFLQIAAILGGLGVALGAFGAHAFKPALEAMGRVETFETAARYQMYGAFVLLIIGILSEKFPNKLITVSGYAFLIGTIIFSGSLYTICLTGITVFGAVAPIGGTALIVGWVCLLLGIKGK